MMATGWSYRDSITSTATSSMIGYDVAAVDGAIGEITEESTAVGSSFLVVDTGFWILDKKRLIPARVVSRIDHDRRRVFVEMTKAEVKDAPDFVPESRIEESHTEGDESSRDPHDIYYRPWFGI